MIRGGGDILPRLRMDPDEALEFYRRLGLSLQTADNAREAGIYAVWTRLSTGRLKVFRSCRNWLDEFRIFASDENGNIVNEPKFHLMAATRYLLLDSLNSRRPEKPKVQNAIARIFLAKSDWTKLDAMMNLAQCGVCR